MSPRMEAMKAQAAATDELVAGVLDTSNWYLSVAYIADTAGITRTRVRAGLRRMDARCLIEADHSGWPPRYRFTEGERRERVMDRLRRTFQAFIDDQLVPPGERIVWFTIDAAAYYQVTPLQAVALLALAPADIAAMNTPWWPGPGGSDADGQ